jgi:hypothetical protein
MMKYMNLSRSLDVALFGAVATGALLWTCASTAYATEQELEALTCSQVASDPSEESDLWKSIESRARRTGHGQFDLDGPVCSGELCIERVTIVGSFGVLVVAAKVSGASFEPLRSFVLSRNPELQPVAAKAPGILAAYEAPKRLLSFFSGAPSVEVNPDPGSKDVSFICAHESSGAQ